MSYVVRCTVEPLGRLFEKVTAFFSLSFQMPIMKYNGKSSRTHFGSLVKLDGSHMWQNSKAWVTVVLNLISLPSDYLKKFPFYLSYCYFGLFYYVAQSNPHKIFCFLNWNPSLSTYHNLPLRASLQSTFLQAAESVNGPQVIKVFQDKPIKHKAIFPK